MSCLDRRSACVGSTVISMLAALVARHSSSLLVCASGSSRHTHTHTHIIGASAELGPCSEPDARALYVACGSHSSQAPPWRPRSCRSPARDDGSERLGRGAARASVVPPHCPRARHDGGGVDQGGRGGARGAAPATARGRSERSPRRPIGPPPQLCVSQALQATGRGPRPATLAVAAGAGWVAHAQMCPWRRASGRGPDRPSTGADTS